MDAIAIIKFRVYKTGMILGAFFVFGIWLIGFLHGDLNPVNRVFLPAIWLLIIWGVRFLNKHGKQALPLLEKLFTIHIFMQLLFIYIYNAWLGLSTGILDLQKYLLWMVILYAISFLVYDRRNALQISGAFYGSIFFIGVLFLYRTRQFPTFWHNISLLFEIFAANLMYIAILYIIVALKEKILDSEVNTRAYSILADTDHLTGLPNRRKINSLINGLITAGNPFCVILIDIDDFKILNDQHGHDKGDEALQYIAQCLLNGIRKNDFAGRWGGDEFTVICSTLDSAEIGKVLERLRELNITPDWAINTPISMSVGTAIYRPGDALETLIKQADLSLYEAKKTKPMKQRESA